MAPHWRQALAVERSGAFPVAALILTAAILAAALLLAFARPAPLTSDESLYLSEAFNIAQGKGLTYPSGDPIVHRPPLFPALLAAAVKVGGSWDAAYWVSKVIALANLGLLFLLARRISGDLAGIVAAVFAAASAFLNWLGTTLFLDGTESLFMLLSLLLLLHAFEDAGGRTFFLAGAALGLAFLTKEAAILWLPLPAIAWLLHRPYQDAARLRGTALFGLAFLATTGWWWAWVYWSAGQVYLLRGPWPLSVALLAAGGAAILLALALWRVRPWPRASRPPRWLLMAAGGALLTCWLAAFLFLLERTSWPVSEPYWRTVPSYLAQAATAVQPWAAIALGWALVGHRAWRGSGQHRLMLLALALFSPFALWVAHRDLHLRDLLPLVYLSYVALGVAASDGLGLARRLLQSSDAARPALVASAALVAALAGGVILSQVRVFVADNRAPEPDFVTQTSWDNPLARQTAAWMEEHIPAGSNVMSTRLYYSHLYVLTEGHFSIRQLPTVGVSLDPDGRIPVQRGSTIFRWEDHRLGEPRPDERWLYLGRYPIKGYFVGLSEIDLLQDIRSFDIDYLVVAGEDAGFSSLTYLDYFLDNPAFSLEHRRVVDGLNQVYVFRVDRGRLAYRDQPVTLSSDTMDALVARGGGPYAEGTRRLLASLAQRGLRVTPAYGLSDDAARLLEVAAPR